MIATATLPITAANWQLSTTTANTVVTDLDALEQSVRILLTTEPGSDPARPDFGVGLLALIGQDMRMVRSNLKRRSKAQFRDYLPEVEVVDFQVSEPTAQGDLSVTVVWKANNTTITTTIQ